MGRFRRLSRAGRLLVVIAVGGAVFGIVSAVQAAIPDANGVIHGCYQYTTTNGSYGNLRVVDTDKGGSCNALEKPLNWNQTGPTGQQGPTGATGPTGPSDGWAGGGSGTVPTGGSFVTIAGATGITPGSYLTSGHVVWAALGAGSADLQCFLTTTGASASSLGGRGIASTAGGGSAPLDGTMTVSSGTATLGVECRETSGTVSVPVTTEVHAIRVGTLH